jgi:hypothetical protein
MYCTQLQQQKPKLLAEDHCLLRRHAIQSDNYVLMFWRSLLSQCEGQRNEEEEEAAGSSKILSVTFL